MNHGPARNFSISIPKEKLAKLPAAHYSGSIRLVDELSLLPQAIAALRNSDIIGFDTETRPSFKKGQTNIVSLMQLATRTECFLIRLNKIGLPDSLKALLEDPDVRKVGLSIHDDFHNLLKLCPDLRPDGFLDLQEFVKKWNIADASLTKINAILFGHRISKGQRLTNWEADTLSANQMQYASLDALACIRIFDFLDSGAFRPEMSPYIVFPDESPSDGDSTAGEEATS